jgi:hypothetical protein
VTSANHSKLLIELNGRFAAGECSFEEYERLDALIRSVPAKRASRWPKRVRHRMTTKNRHITRKMAYSGPLPPHLAARYTTGQLAVLGVLVAQGGHSDITVTEFAMRAGVSHRTAQNALRLAHRDGLLRITERRRKGCKSLTNLVNVIDREWLAWIARRLKGTGRKPQGPSEKNIYQKGASGPSANHSRAFVAPKREGRGGWPGASGGDPDRGPS